MTDQSPPQSPQELIRSLSENFQKVSFGGGVVGRTAHAYWGLLAIWLVIVYRLSASVLLDGVLVGSGLIITGAVMWWVKRTHTFAERNPVQSMLSGSEFVEIQRYMAQAKGLPNPETTALVEVAPSGPPSSDPKQPDRP
jgi:hypothetical protein